ncbi:Integrator complex subunit [Trema orientale]|uniref:Integrator complex subunit n=1 Tax=Trema orientale TaxID=63057 RepID=A0A2P5CAR5_TREOI|nr:Integrator complex subunit [Trema orientale]
MKFTCLSKGGGFNFPPCHILHICGFRVLFDAPLDLSALTIFSPVPGGPDGLSGEEALCCRDLVHAEPCYKTVKNLHLWDASFIDVVLISSPMGMLGLPFLTRMKGFSAKIYVTEATAKLGELMMKDLVSVHMEFRQFYGDEESAFPQWMKWEELVQLPSRLKEIALGKDGEELGGWMTLYSAADLKDCVQKVRTLKYAEETCYNGTLVIKAVSSGLEIGACNWAINSPKGDIAFISSSIFVSGHSMGFDYHALEGNDLILYSDFSFMHTMDDLDSEFNSASGTDSLRFLASADDILEERDKLAFVCSYAVDAVKTGGSVLIPIDRLGVVLQLLEEISASLDSSNLKVPIYFISSVSEELLAFTNVIPEWLCRERQEKLFSGKPLFGHVELMKEKKLHVFPAVYSTESLMNWQEPCIVFCPNWSLRLGPVVHLLHRWCGDQNSLLVLENGIDAELALLPFKPIAMKVLQCSFLSGINLRKVQPLLEILQPKVVLFPEDLKQISSGESMPFSVLHYSENETLLISSLKSSEVELPMELATQFHFKKLKQEHISVARLKGELLVGNSKHQLISGSKQADQKCRPVLCWGSPDIETLLAVLSERGIKGTVGGGTMDSKFENVSVVHVHEPNRACIEIRVTTSVVTAADEDLASQISDAICSVLAST